MLDILARLNISRWARWGQAEHLKMWRSIPHTTTVSVSTCIRRIPAPHGEEHEGEVELRQIFELDDFEQTPAVEEARKLEENLPKR